MVYGRAKFEKLVTDFRCSTSYPKMYVQNLLARNFSLKLRPFNLKVLTLKHDFPSCVQPLGQAIPELNLANNRILNIFIVLIFSISLQFLFLGMILYRKSLVS